MVLGKFQCRGLLLSCTWIIVGKGLFSMEQVWDGGSYITFSSHNRHSNVSHRQRNISAILNPIPLRNMTFPGTAQNVHSRD